MKLAPIKKFKSTDPFVLREISIKYNFMPKHKHKQHAGLFKT